ncbi:MAG: hypothetical protein V3573_07540 [Desulfovibrionaceae bacterium]
MPEDKPYLNEKGDLVIPFACPDHADKYWKAEGRKLKDILQDIQASDEVMLRYLPKLPKRPEPSKGGGQEES